MRNVSSYHVIINISYQRNISISANGAGQRSINNEDNLTHHVANLYSISMSYVHK